MTSTIVAEGPGSAGAAVHGAEPRSRGARLRVADALRDVSASQLEEEFGFRPTRVQRRLLEDIKACGTSVLGGRGVLCKRCGWSHQRYNGCRNRLCPTCASRDARRWVEERRGDVLPVPYDHVVFTIPGVLSDLALNNGKVLYEIAMSSAGQTLMGALSGSGGGTPGVLTVLHTWSQELMHHVHVHCVVAGGVLSRDQGRWESRGPEALQASLLMDEYRRRFVQQLEQAHHEGRVEFVGRCEGLADPGAFDLLLRTLAVAPSWGAYVQAQSGPVEPLLAYLVRTPMTDDRIVRVEGDFVRFSCRGRGDSTSTREVSMHALEFGRRLLMHVLPKGFVRIRYYGFWSHSARKKKLARIRELLGVAAAGGGAGAGEAGGGPDVASDSERADADPCEFTECPQCGSVDLEHFEERAHRITRAFFMRPIQRRWDDEDTS